MCNLFKFRDEQDNKSGTLFGLLYKQTIELHRNDFNLDGSLFNFCEHHFCVSTMHSVNKVHFVVQFVNIVILKSVSMP